MTPAAPLLLLLLAASPATATAPDTVRCELADARTMGDLQARLSRRAVDAVGMAATARDGDDSSLLRLVAPTATFSLGAGDVGRPLGTGAEGARALARDMKADSFRFLGWSFIPTPVADPCGRQEVQVDFFDSKRKALFPVTFIFEGGRIVEAKGWSRSYESGPMTPPPHVD